VLFVSLYLNTNLTLFLGESNVHKYILVVDWNPFSRVADIIAHVMIRII
jgi:hypothetical protein